MNILKPKFIVPIAIIAGLLATLIVYRYLQQKKQQAEENTVEMMEITVARMDLPIGRVIGENEIKMVEWPKDNLPLGAFYNQADIMNRVLKSEIFEGEPILESKLAPVGSLGGLSSLIPPGMRALTVQVNDYSGVGGFILPNTRVDVLITVSTRDREDARAKVILENIKVLATDQTFIRKGDDPKLMQTVTLLVTPEEAEKLALANEEGNLQLSLRNNADSEIKDTHGARLKELITRPRRYRSYTPPRTKSTTVVEKPRERTVEVIRSNERSKVIFEEEK
ncbi:Flp pilus assembly protein CpaB [candidate division KSB1 bacterium]|nr:Flp pilus assembly protein CpaB [candidate division KSB1 bacterium]